MNLEQLSKFYLWTDNVLRGDLDQVSDENFTMKSGEGRSLRQLVEHYVMSYQYPTYSGDFKERMNDLRAISRKDLLEEWKSATKEFSSFLTELKDGSHEMEVADGKKVKLNQANYALVYTDHQTYHRGQITMKLRDLGYEPSPTDYWSFLGTL